MVHFGAIGIDVLEVGTAEKIWKQKRQLMHLNTSWNDDFWGWNWWEKFEGR